MTQYWYIGIDWDNDGGGYNEASLVFEYSARRGREMMINSNSSGFGQAFVGKATLQLWNDDRRFDPFYTSSPLYGLIAPERRIEIGVEVGGTDFLLLETGDKILQESGDGIYKSESGSTGSKRFVGVVDDIQPGMRNGERIVTITAVDNWRTLRDSSAVWVDVASDTNAGAAIGLILDEIEFSASARDIDTGDDLSYFWTTGKKADKEIKEIVESGFGQVYFSGDGKFTFNDRSTIFNATEDITITEAVLDEEIETPYMWQMIKNKIVVVAHPITEQSDVELWSLFDTPRIGPGDSLTLWCNLTYDNRPVVATTIADPVATTDYTANTESDGSGTDLTSSFSIVVTKLGRRAKLVVTNDGTSAGYMTSLTLSGDALDTPSASEVEAVDADSTFSESVLTLDSPWMQSLELAQNYADWLVSWLNEQLFFPTVRLFDQDDKTLAADLFTRVRVDLDTLEIDNDYYISKIVEFWISSSGQGLDVYWSLEPSDMTVYWQFTTEIGLTSRFSY